MLSGPQGVCAGAEAFDVVNDLLPSEQVEEPHAKENSLGRAMRTFIEHVEQRVRYE